MLQDNQRQPKTTWYKIGTYLLKIHFRNTHPNTNIDETK